MEWEWSEEPFEDFVTLVSLYRDDEITLEKFSRSVRERGEELLLGTFEWEGEEGFTIFHYVSEHGGVVLMKRILDLYRDITTEKHGALGAEDRTRAYAHAATGSGMTAIHFAARGCSEMSVRFLINEFGFRVDAANSTGGTPLHFAVGREDLLVVYELLDGEGGNDLLETRDGVGLTLLHLAVFRANKDITRLILERYEEANGKEALAAFVNAKTTNGFTALHFAADGTDQNGWEGRYSLELYAVLKQAGGDAEIISGTTETPREILRKNVSEAVFEQLEGGSLPDNAS